MNFTNIILNAKVNRRNRDIDFYLLGQTRHNLPNRCKSCKPGSTVDTTMKTPEHSSPARPREMNNCLRDIDLFILFPIQNH